MWGGAWGIGVAWEWVGLGRTWERVRPWCSRVLERPGEVGQGPERGGALGPAGHWKGRGRGGGARRGGGRGEGGGETGATGRGQGVGRGRGRGLGELGRFGVEEGGIPAGKAKRGDEVGWGLVRGPWRAQLVEWRSVCPEGG